MIQLFSPLVIPFDRYEEVDHDALRRNVNRYETAPLDGYLVNGSSGEAEMLTEEERLAVLRTVCDCTGKLVIAGLTATSVRDALGQLRSLNGLELHAVMFRTPSYFGSQLDQVEFFYRVCEASIYPVMAYQIPQLTGVKLKAREMREMVRHSNLVGFKDSLGDLSLLTEVEWPAGFRYFLGASSLLLPGIAAGSAGGILALANVVPDLCRELLDLASDPAQGQRARELQRRLIPLNRLLGGSEGFGLAGLKAACEMRGYEGGLPRLPLKRIGEKEKGQLEAALSLALTGTTLT